MELKDLAIAGIAGIAAYAGTQYVLFKLSVDATDYWEARGYINGLIRGAGSVNNAVSQLHAWRDYWYQRSGWARFIIDHLFNYGMNQIRQTYSESTSVSKFNY